MIPETVRIPYRRLEALLRKIRLSQKHGLNPCISQCLFCGGDKNEIAVLGALADDKEAPRKAVLDYEPCEACKSNFAAGIAILESEDGRTPTGAYVVITEDATRRLFAPEALVEQLLQKRKALMDKPSFTRLFRGAKSE